MHSTDDIHATLESRLDPAIDLLREMVAINTFTENRAGVNRLGELTAGSFAPLGFAAETVPAADGRFGDHLVLTRPGRTPAVVGCVSHLDTVFTPEETLAHDFHWREAAVNGLTRCHGPGTVDIKGGTVMIHLVLSALAACRPALFEAVTWKLFFNAAEERLVPDFGALVRRHLDPAHTAACLVFEGGRWQNGDFRLVTQRKGMGQYRIQVTGRSAHAGVAHEQGASAVTQLAEIVQRIAGLTDYERQLTFNVGTISGGVVMNRVAHQAEALVEFRAFDPEVYQEALISMRSLQGYSTVRSPADGYACQTAVEQQGAVRPWPENAATGQLYAFWAEAAAELGFTAAAEARGGLSDGNLTWAHVPTLDGLGPAGGWAHSSETSADGSKEQEYVIRESFVPKGLLNAAALCRLIEPIALENGR